MGDSRYIYKSEVDKACFQHNIPYGDLKHFPKRTTSEKVLRDKALDIAENSKYEGYQKVFAIMAYKFIKLHCYFYVCR